MAQQVNPKRCLQVLAVFGAVMVPLYSQPVHRLDPALDKLISPSATVEKLAEGFRFTEGPVWMRKGGYLLFSDIPGNAIMQWNPDGKISIFRRPVFAGSFPPGAQAGSNGLTVDRLGRLIAAEHANRRVTRTEKDDSIEVIADRYQGKRLNSPNDVVVKKDGDIYFTDPSFGLRSMMGPSAPGVDPPGFAEAKELDFNGVFRVSRGKVTLFTKDVKTPNGLAFSPDEKKLYVSDSDASRKAWWVFDVTPTGTAANGRIFADLSKSPGGVPDGLKVDELGNVWGTGPGGVVIFSPEGKLLGTIQFPEQPANLAWGDADGKALYVTARTGLYRIHTEVQGIRP